MTVLEREEGVGGVWLYREEVEKDDLVGVKPGASGVRVGWVGGRLQDKVLRIPRANTCGHNTSPVIAAPACQEVDCCLLASPCPPAPSACLSANPRPRAPSACPADRRRVHGSMYSGLRTNLPREVMGFTDYPFDAVFPGSLDPRQFPSHQVRSAPATPSRLLGNFFSHSHQGGRGGCHSA